MRRGVLVVVCASCLIVSGCLGAGPATDVETPAPADDRLEVHSINVGQSAATLVVAPNGETMLIDTGDFTDDGEHVLEYLQRHNIQRIDYLVTSHNDADHIGGNAEVIEYFETEANGIGAIYDPGIAASTQTYEAYLDAVERHDVPLYRTDEGDSIPMDGVDIEVLGPPQPYLENEARNENSIVLKLTYGSTSFLFPGDAEDDQEAYLVERYGGQLTADVLSAGHHGSRTSSSRALLAAVDPAAVVVSSAYDSRYGHPHEETLQRFADRSIPTYWTGVHGSVVLASDGERITVATQAAAPTAPLELREAGGVSPDTTGPVSPRAEIVDGELRPVTGTPIGTTTSTTPVTTDGGVSLELASVHPDAEGDDRDNLNDEYLVLANSGDESIDLSGWTITDAAGLSYTVPDGVSLEPGATITVHTGSGTHSETDLYWGAGQPVWNNDGDTVTVTDASGQVVLEETY